jgi:Flagellar biosynthesis protein, FliO
MRSGKQNTGTHSKSRARKRTPVKQSKARKGAARRSVRAKITPIAIRAASNFGMQLRTLYRRAIGSFRILHGQAIARRLSRRMTVCETVQLGDKRIVALLKVDDRHILIGASGNSVSMLTEIPAQPAFSQVLSKPTLVQVEA